jgi:energy-coupling factor transport system permease protein
MSQPSSSFYTPRESPVHRWHPRTKLVYTGCAVLLAFVAPWPVLAAGLFVVATGLALLARALGAYVRMLRGALLLLFVALFVIQGLFYPGRETPLFRIGPVTVWVEGVRYALEVAARLLAMVGSMGVLVLTTRPADLATGLQQWGISHRFGYAVLLTLQIVPEMQRRVRTILDAQRTRGVETEGNLVHRIRAFVPVLGPLVTSSILGIETRALALEARGFSLPGPRTRAYPPIDSRAQAVARWLMLGVGGAIVFYRVLTWALRFVT